jgi:hypothetical protein
LPSKSLSRSSLLSFQKYSSLLAGNTPYLPSSYDLLETEILTGTAASVTFSSLDTLAAGYQHLQIRAAYRTDRTPTYKGDGVSMQVNGDTGSNYAYHRLLGYGGSVSSGANTSRTYLDVSAAPSAIAPANEYGPVMVDLLDPFETTKNTTIRSLGGGYNGNDPVISLRSGVWMNTAAVTSLQLFSVTGSNWVSGSRFSLYGLKAA